MTGGNAGPGAGRPTRGGPARPPGEGPAQWKKCRVPVKYIVTPAVFAASIDQLVADRAARLDHRLDARPSASTSRPSGNGKNASEAA